MDSEMKAEEVLAIRERLGVTQELLAEAMGVSVRTYRRWETEGSIPEVAAKLLARMVEVI